MINLKIYLKKPNIYLVVMIHYMMHYQFFDILKKFAGVLHYAHWKLSAESQAPETECSATKTGVCF